MTDEVGPVAIVGAGIGGLTLAIALHRRGVPVTVYERATELREVGAAVGLSANGLTLLAELGLLDALDDAGSEPVEFAYRHWNSAARLEGFPVGRDGTYRSRFGTPWLGIHRAEFQRVLGAACPPGVLRLGRAVERIVDHGDRVELGLGDGSTAAAGIVVGADGVHSRTRALVDPQAVPVYTGSSGFRGLVPVTDVPLLPGVDAIQLWMGPDAHVVHYPIGRRAETVNFLAVFEGPVPWEGPPGPWAQPPGTLDHLVRDWSPGIRQMLGAVPQSDRWPLYTLPPMRRWSAGRVVLLGDAVHTMVPHHGQGANQTVEDVAVLVECLSTEREHARAFARYERLRRARARQVTRSSLVTGPWLHLPDGEQADRRDAGLAAVGPWLEWIHGHDVRAALR